MLAYAFVCLARFLCVLHKRSCAELSYSTFDQDIVPHPACDLLRGGDAGTEYTYFRPLGRGQRCGMVGRICSSLVVLA
jgi:hypothetical protein